MDTYILYRGTAPLLVSLPHDGTDVPDDIAARLTGSARRVPDTDWHVSKLYEFARGLGASVIVPKYSRYVIDLNRPEDDVSLYPGQNTTGLCPHVQFSGVPVYAEGREPDENEVGSRIERFWRPYHRALAGELQRIHAQHGRAGLWEGHSIRGVVPFLFEGRLPDLNLGTAAGTSCSPALQSRLESVLASQATYDFIVNGRFKGGYITRQYGNPAQCIDAVQLEISQRNYMDEASFAWDPGKAAQLQVVLRKLLEQMLA
ncbi:MAG: N-formylglutamate deformylase [Pseudoxanthomonas sp.]